MSATPAQDSSPDPAPLAPKGTPTTGALSQNDTADWVDVLRQHVASLRFGVIQVVIHEGRVVQIERTEKYRLPNR
jgi:hypothetical protein